MENDQEYSDSSRTYFKKDLMPNTSFYVSGAANIQKKGQIFTDPIPESTYPMDSLCKSLQDWDWEPEKLRKCDHAAEMMRARRYFLAFFWYNRSLLLHTSLMPWVSTFNYTNITKELMNSLRPSKKRFSQSNLCQDIKRVCFRQAQVNLREIPFLQTSDIQYVYHICNRFKRPYM